MDAIPFVRFDEAKRLVAEKYGHPTRSRFDLEPEEEVLIGRYFKEEMGSDFVFVTHYPTRKRPFYAMDDPEDPSLTLSFDLLFREWRSPPEVRGFTITICRWTKCTVWAWIRRSLPPF